MYLKGKLEYYLLLYNFSKEENDYAENVPLSITQKLSLPIHQFFSSHRHHHIITTSTIVITERSAVENVKPKRYIGVNK